MVVQMWSGDPMFGGFRGDARYEKLLARFPRLVKPMKGATVARP